ncbi:alpha/beta hydrolase [Streptomyces sp. NBC_01136]|uniref:alpha/beta fold hydrolase n=1 Tax=unclassified Streptomyces TaxID=2593676 RepID=UPI00324A77BA|nr:alpha/beta hydrolase [Streptomyces sp. NBC_01136]
MSTVTIQPQTRLVDGLTIRYAEAGRDGAPTVLLTNPWPESLYAFAALWDTLAADFHITAIDLPGFGHSQGRPELYSPLAMAGFLARLVDEWELGAPHLVSPDVGCSAALLLAAEHPGMVASLTVGSGGTAFPLQVSGALKDIIEASDPAVFGQADGRDVVAGVVDAIPGHPLPAEVREDYLSAYEGDRFVRSTAYVRNYPHDLPILAERLGSITAPVQIITGGRDPLVPTANAEYLRDRLPGSRLHILDAGHFVWEEAAKEYTDLVAAWLHERSR